MCWCLSENKTNVLPNHKMGIEQKPIPYRKIHSWNINDCTNEHADDCTEKKQVWLFNENMGPTWNTYVWHFVSRNNYAIHVLMTCGYAHITGKAMKAAVLTRCRRKISMMSTGAHKHPVDTEKRETHQQDQLMTVHKRAKEDIFIPTNDKHPGIRTEKRCNWIEWTWIYFSARVRLLEIQSRAQAEGMVPGNI